MFIVDLLAGCLYSQLNVADPLLIDGTCITTCFLGVVVHYICNQSSSHSLGSARCVAQSTWSQTCTPGGE